MKKRSDGRYRIKIPIGKDVYGKTQYKYIYGTDRKALESEAAKLKSDAQKGMDVLNYEAHFSEVVSSFLIQEESRQTDHIYKVKKANLKAFTDEIGNLPIKDIKPYHIESVLRILANKNPHTRKPTSHKTLIEYRNVCSQVFKFAIKNRITDYNPCEYAVICDTAKPTKKRRALTEAERDAIMQCECDAKLPAMLMMFAGLRRGEAAALTWKDIDFKANLITVDKAYDYANRKLKSTKTENGIRTIPMPKILADYLKTIKKKSVYVVSKNGKMITDAGWEKLLSDLQTEMETILGNDKLKKVKVGNKYKTLISFQSFGWHDLRHTYASLLAYSGISPAEAKDLLGHSDIATTLNIYTHLNDEVKQATISKFDSYLGVSSGVKDAENT